MPRVLVLLPGNPIVVDPASPFTELNGEDVRHTSFPLRRIEYVNNLQTIEALAKALGPTWEVLVRYQVGRKGLPSIVSHAFALRKFVEEHEIDLVHQFWGGPPALANALTVNVPFVLSLLGSDLMGSYNQQLKPTWHGRLLATFSKLTTKYTAATVVMSRKMKHLLSPHLKAVFVIPEGVDTRKFYPIAKDDACRALGWPVEGFKVLFFNYGHAVKNAPLAYRIFEYVKRFVPHAELVQVKGVPHEQLVYYYNACDVLLLTSLHEGSNNSLKEAIACGCPVVSSDVGDASERLQGITPSMVVKGFQPDDYAAFMIELAGKPTRSNGPLKVHEIGLPHLGSQLARVYAEVLKHPVSGHEEQIG